MLENISTEALQNVTGGAAPSWSAVRDAAAPHCPNTVAKFSTPPANRAQAQAMGNACIAEMGSMKADMFGGRQKIQAGIDAAFPRR